MMMNSLKAQQMDGKFIFYAASVFQTAINEIKA